MTKKLLPLLVATMVISPAFGEDLSQVYALAKENDAQIQAARATRDAALEAKPQAKSQLRPTVSLSADASRTRKKVFTGGALEPTGVSYSSPAQLSLSLSQPVYHRDYFIQLEQADKQIAQAEATFAAEEQGLMVRASQAYFSVLAAQESLEFAKAENAAIARQLDQAKQRFEVGLIAITDVHEAQAAFDQSRADLINAENQVDNAWEALFEITGTQVGELAQVKDELALTPPQPQNLDQWAETAQQQNLVVQATLYGVQIARQNVELQRSGHYPTVDLVGSHTLNRTLIDTGSENNTTNLSLQLNVPLYTGGAVTSKVGQAVLEHEAAQQSLDKERRSVNRQVRDAFRGVLTSISTVEALKASTISAQSALEATEAGFGVGTRTMVDVLNAQRDLFRAKSNYATVRYEYILSGLQLKQSTGTLTQDDLADVNSWLN